MTAWSQYTPIGKGLRRGYTGIRRSRAVYACYSVILLNIDRYSNIAVPSIATICSAASI